ncbi:MAG: LAGLIDADG family homing endonuclease [archaeon]
METAELIFKFQEFIEQNCQNELAENISKGLKFLHVDFSLVAKFSPELADFLIEQPEDGIRAAELSMERFDVDTKQFKIRLFNLPRSQHIRIRDIRSQQIGLLLQIEGIVRQKSDVRPQVTMARFECPSCGNIMNIIQVEAKFKEPTRCNGCARTGKFRMINKELVDAQKIVLEEAPEELEGGEQPKRLSVFLKNDLVSPMSEKRTNPGSRITVVGVVHEIPIMDAGGVKSTRYDLILEANHVKPVLEDFTWAEISPKEQEQIIALSQDPKVYRKLCNSIAPSIYGHERVKEALVLQLMGGAKKTREDGITVRGDIHVLLVGDPGSGKSQLIKRVSMVAPKARFVSGKGASGAGMTASVVRDEFIRGFALEAGALVLTNNGICCIDELDKMSKEDTSAMHEALEQQSYHYNTEIMFADGSTEKIGTFVDELLDGENDNIIKGKECEILIRDDFPRILTTDFSSIWPVRIANVSRHKAPDHFYKITYRNGQHIVVTPEHPIYIAQQGAIATCAAQDVQKGMMAPAPRLLPMQDMREDADCADVDQQQKTEQYGLYLGLQCSEGHTYANSKQRYAEVGISTTNAAIQALAHSTMQTVFGKTPSVHVRAAEQNAKASKPLFTVRTSSKQSYQLLMYRTPELLQKAPKKRVPQEVKTGSLALKQAFLQGFFLGDGFVDSERVGFSTSSRYLAEDLQQILLQLDMVSSIQTENRAGKFYYKVILSGMQSYETFYHNILHPVDGRRQRVHMLMRRSANKANDRDVLPHEHVQNLVGLLKAFRICDGYFYRSLCKQHHAHRRTMWHYLVRVEQRLHQALLALSGTDVKNIKRLWAINTTSVANEMACSTSSIRNYMHMKHTKYQELLSVVCTLAQRKKDKILPSVLYLHNLLTSDIRFVQITNVERIPNHNEQWTYDVTVEPLHTFISKNLVLHNTVSINKANIQATLRAETTVLAAANPKFGRFDPFEMIAKQIDLPSTLINRFDLIFPIRDMPDKSKDEKLASFVLNLHQGLDVKKADIPTELFKKYVSYARMHIRPKLSTAALSEIKEYYVKMRSSGEREGEISAIPITARQLEALVRLAEASARTRLNDTVTKADARVAIELMHFCLTQIGVDPETGRIDIDRISTGITASQRGHMHTIKDIITELEAVVGKMIPIEDIIREAGNKNIDADKVDEVLEKLRRSGDLFSPKPGHISKV